ncbi:putative signal peptide protein, partial [Puccinia sorghi]
MNVLLTFSFFNSMVLLHSHPNEKRLCNQNFTKWYELRITFGTCDTGYHVQSLSQQAKNSSLKEYKTLITIKGVVNITCLVLLHMIFSLLLKNYLSTTFDVSFIPNKYHLKISNVMHRWPHPRNKRFLIHLRP